MKFLDCENLAGSLTLGAALEGGELEGVARMTGAFGLPCLMANRERFGMHVWQDEPVVGKIDTDWTRSGSPIAALHGKVDALFGTPPCSGFSKFNLMHLSLGSANPINACMKEVVALGAWLRAPAICFESVQGAYHRGRDLMLSLRAMVESYTGQEYDLHHLLHTAGSLGAAQLRPRYYWLAVRRGLPVRVPEPAAVRPPAAWEAWGDLPVEADSWDEVAYATAPSWWAAGRQRADGKVDGHVSDPKMTARIRALAPYYQQIGGKESGITGAAKRWRESGDPAPEPWTAEALHHALFREATYVRQPWRRDHHEVARVITGAGGMDHCHPSLRPLSARECFRLMGFPDEWRLAPATRSVGKAYAWSGKQMCVETARWVARLTFDALAGNEPAGAVVQPTLIGDREWVHDVSDRVYRYVTKMHRWTPLALGEESA